MWKIEFEEEAQKTLNKLDKTIKNQIIKYINKILNSDKNPRAFGEPLLGNKAGLWRYRVGDYRIVCSITDKKLLILVLQIDHRSQVYK